MDISTPFAKDIAADLVSAPDLLRIAPRYGASVLFSEALTYLSYECHARSVVAGWWDKPRNAGECIALMHSELSEALEGVRKGAQDEHLPGFTSEEVELADSLIRHFDYAGARQLRLGEAFVAKLLYNANRADHKPEARAATGGKKF